MSHYKHKIKHKEYNRITHCAVLAVHSSLFSTDVLDFLHSFHLVLICDRVGDREAERGHISSY